MNKLILRLATIGLLLSLSPARAGVVIGGTRFIYPAGASSLSVPLRNTSATSWLINSHIQSAVRWPGADPTPVASPPFIVTPPLFLLAAGQENTLRLVYSGGSLPNDRESLFTLSIAAIPSGKPSANSVQMAFRSAMKLLYRPFGLSGDPQQAYRQLRWSLAPEGLLVHNPTPYYITLFLLNIDGSARDGAGVVAPFSTRRLRGCQKAAHCAIRWQSINDDGRVMPPVVINAVENR